MTAWFKVRNIHNDQSLLSHRKISHANKNWLIVTEPTLAQRAEFEKVH